MAKGKLGQIAGMLGVILSLAFVGLEIRQNNTIARSAALNDLAAGQREWLLAIANDPELAELWNLWVRDVVEGDSLPPGDFSRVRALAQAYVANLENVYLQAESGVAGGGVLGHYFFTGSPNTGSENFIAFWATMRDRQHPDFVEEFEREYPQLRP